MEMRPVRIIALGTLGLTAAFLLPEIQEYALFAMAAAPILLLALGQFFLPRSKRQIQIWFDPLVLDEDEKTHCAAPAVPFARLSGKELAYSAFKQWHDFEIVPHHFLLLGLIGLCSFGFLFLAWQTQELFAGAGYFYLLGSIWISVTSLALRWVWERRTLRHEGVTIGGFSVHSGPKPIYITIRYHFVDPDGEYRGGIIESMFCDKADDITVIFYNENNPDQSVPAAALLFHKLLWKEHDRVAPRPVYDTEGPPK
jgi:hypothetical protein